MRKEILICVLLCGLIFFGCSSVPDATDEKPTLIIGEVYFTGENLTGTPHLNMGLFRMGIEVTLIDSAGNEVLLKTDRAGIFYLNDVREGRYRISKMLVKSDRGGWVSTSPSPPFSFEIVPEQVNNIGRIEWHRNANKSTYNYNNAYDSVQNDFETRYKKSNWINGNWNNVNLTRDL
ncbi:hypothetical protein LJC14_03285 [Treponema sp. OttesenSCG-928-L16]|nr:hypothetical protein [Treponema sp. OttesenSCG-928-L16]